MNRQYSRDGLLKQYQIEASGNRDRKIAEKQIQVLEERKVLDYLNMQMEQEKRQTAEVKNKRTNDRVNDYNTMIMKKQSERDNNTAPHGKKKEDLGTFKIGGENRQIKRKTYDDISNDLILNPTRTNIQSEGMNRQGRNEVQNSVPQSRGKSQGFNIINHSWCFVIFLIVCNFIGSSNKI